MFWGCFSCFSKRRIQKERTYDTREPGEISYWELVSHHVAIHQPFIDEKFLTRGPLLAELLSTLTLRSYIVQQTWAIVSNYKVSTCITIAGVSAQFISPTLLHLSKDQYRTTADHYLNGRPHSAQQVHQHGDDILVYVEVVWMDGSNIV